MYCLTHQRLKITRSICQTLAEPKVISYYQKSETLKTFNDEEIVLFLFLFSGDKFDDVY